VKIDEVIEMTELKPDEDIRKKSVSESIELKKPDRIEVKDEEIEEQKPQTDIETELTVKKKVIKKKMQKSTEEILPKDESQEKVDEVIETTELKPEEDIRKKSVSESIEMKKPDEIYIDEERIEVQKPQTDIETELTVKKKVIKKKTKKSTEEIRPKDESQEKVEKSIKTTEQILSVISEDKKAKISSVIESFATNKSIDILGFLNVFRKSIFYFL
jgi:hypothetical protein